MKVEHVVREEGIFIYFAHESSEEFSALQSVSIKSLVPGVGILKAVFDSDYPHLSHVDDSDESL